MVWSYENIFCAQTKQKYQLYSTSLFFMSASAPIHESTMTQRGQKALGFHQKYLNLSSEDERRSYGFGTTGRWDDRIFIFGWTIPLKILIIDKIHKQYILCLYSLREYERLKRLFWHDLFVAVLWLVEISLQNDGLCRFSSGILLFNMSKKKKCIKLQREHV